MATTPLNQQSSLATSSAPQRKVVIKVGGELVRGDSVGKIAQDIASLVKSGALITLVHGGGPQATALQKKLGQTPNIVGGRRITDNDALEVMKMTVGGAVNINLCAALLRAGLSPVGLHGASALAIQAVKRPPRVITGCGPDPIDFGAVGDVTGCNQKLIETLHHGGFTPVLACLGANPDGDVFNINADIVASQISKALQADHLVLVTSAPGVLKDIADASSRIPRLTRQEAKTAIVDKVIVGGMIPKIEEALRVLENGVGAVHIIGEDAAIAKEIASPGTFGTVLVP